MESALLFVIGLLVIVQGQGIENVEVTQPLLPQCGDYCFNLMRKVLEEALMLRHDDVVCKNLSDSSVVSRLDKIDRTLLMQQEWINKHVTERNPISVNNLALYNKIGSKYYYISDVEALNWYAARDRCVELGGHLFNLQSEAELSLLTEALKPHSFWTDVSDLSKLNDYRSSTSGLRTKFMKWKVGEPNHFNGQENCVEITFRNSIYVMNDQNCKKKFNYVCELY